jgi:hypothetical protein
MSNFSTPPDFVVPQREPTWPKVIGIISIVIGSLGLLCNCFGLVALPMTSQMLEVMPGMQGQTPPPDALPGPASYVVAAMSLLGSALLLTAGILLLKRSALSKPLHLAYAGIAIPMTIIAIMLQLTQQAALTQWMKDMGQSMPAGQGIGQVIGVVVGSVVSLAYPIFLLVWFGAMGKKVPQATHSNPM